METINLSPRWGIENDMTVCWIVCRSFEPVLVDEPGGRCNFNRWHHRSDLVHWSYQDRRQWSVIGRIPDLRRRRRIRWNEDQATRQIITIVLNWITSILICDDVSFHRSAVVQWRQSDFGLTAGPLFIDGLQFKVHHGGAVTHLYPKVWKAHEIASHLSYLLPGQTIAVFSSRVELSKSIQRRKKWLIGCADRRGVATVGPRFDAGYWVLRWYQISFQTFTMATSTTPSKPTPAQHCQSRKLWIFFWIKNCHLFNAIGLAVIKRYQRSPTGVF